MYINRQACNNIISAAILDFWHQVSSDSVTDSTIDKFDPENMGIDTRMMFLSRQIDELLLAALCTPSSAYDLR